MEIIHETPERRIQAADMERMVARAIENTDTPIDGGFGYDFGPPSIMQGISYAGEVPASPAEPERSEYPNYPA